jgi:hypothetical protein
MTQSNQDIESRIQDAIDTLSDGKMSTVASAAREFDVPYQRLLRRRKGGKSLFQRDPTGRRLDSAQENALCSWINYRDELSMPPSVRISRKLRY